MDRSFGDAIEGERDDEDASAVDDAAEEDAMERGDAHPALPVDIGAPGARAADVHGDRVLFIDVAVDERVFDGVVAGAEPRVAAGGARGKEREGEGDGCSEAAHARPTINERAATASRFLGAFATSGACPKHRPRGPGRPTSSRRRRRGARIVDLMQSKDYEVRGGTFVNTVFVDRR